MQPTCAQSPCQSRVTLYVHWNCVLTMSTSQTVALLASLAASRASRNVNEDSCLALSVSDKLVSNRRSSQATA